MINKFTIQDKEFEVDTELQKEVTIKSFPEDYNITFSKFDDNFTDKNVVLVDKNVRSLYNIQHSKLIEIEAIEENKSIETVLSVCERLLEYKFDKGHTLIVIGGGILQDIGAFTAKMYKRGINWQFVPTTLLSQCDSCIGGKTALNFKTYKNQLALFSAPQKVTIDTRFLTTLNDKDIISGYGEVIKLFLIGGSYYINNLKSYNIDSIIYHSLMIKKAIIEYDEFELLERKSLNYGHSFGHVIETLTNYQIPHGEAVLLGIQIINKLFTNSESISNIISNYTSLSKIKDINFHELVNRLSSDKKVTNGIISLVVVTEPGKTNFIDYKIDEFLLEKVYEIFAN
jgi:3-dehydroquinate synthase